MMCLTCRRFARPQMQEVKMKNISIIEASGATIEPGMAQIRLDPEQINQLMNGSGLQLSLAQITKVKEDPKGWVFLLYFMVYSAKLERPFCKLTQSLHA